MQKQLDVIIRSLRSTLEENGVGDILQMREGMLMIETKLLDCDMYRLLDGDPAAVNEYRGEYMSEYGWANMTEALLDRVSGRMAE